ncbi:MAG TPA: TadE/TadG family type IV pilus assembly protein [Candidatus Limnocylindrales bacterium]|nr:TadE/TadG family type IV pilus assembly protein [Candidatus Limnocylindrales bacterium]
MTKHHAVHAHRRRHSRAQALVEFSLVAPIFFLMIFAVIEGGRFILYYQTLNNAVREGARYAIVHGSNSFCPSGPMPPGSSTPGGCYDASGANVAQQVRTTAFGVLGTGVTVTTCWDPVIASDGSCTNGGLGNGRDSEVRVTGVYTYRSLVPIVPLPAISISAESNLVINN